MPDTDYHHLLVAVDLTDESEQVIARAQRMRRLTGARVSIVHVVEATAAAIDALAIGYSAEVPLSNDLGIDAQIMDEARETLGKLCDPLELDAADIHIRTGPTGPTIDALASELGVDLIVIGSHGRHGLFSLFDSTTKSVLRDSHCDVLCIPLK